MPISMSQRFATTDSRSYCPSSTGYSGALGSGFGWRSIPR